MVDMGFGLTREGIMAMPYAILEKTGRNHPFKNGHAARGWYEGFMLAEKGRCMVSNYSSSGKEASVYLWDQCCL